MTCKNKYMTPFSGAGISDLSNILARHANACIGVRGFFIIDTPIPSWIGLRDKKASGFIPVCALVPVFYVSHNICLTYFFTAGFSTLKKESEEENNLSLNKLEQCPRLTTPDPNA